MGILIRGMEMPEYCGECKLKAEYDGETFCPFFADNVEFWIAAGRRHEDCPLGYIPPHGDLIDRREAIIDANERAYDFWLSDDEVNATIRFLNEQTTIIKAEDNDETT